MNYKANTGHIKETLKDQTKSNKSTQEKENPAEEILFAEISENIYTVYMCILQRQNPEEKMDVHYG